MMTCHLTAMLRQLKLGLITAEELLIKLKSGDSDVSCEGRSRFTPDMSST